MQPQTFPAGETPRVTITGCQGALNVEFWDRRDFVAEPSLPESAIDRENAALIIHQARADIRLRVPAATEIAIEDHNGDVRIATIDGSVRLRDINGSVFVTGAGRLAIERDQLLRRRPSSPRPRRDVEAHEIGTAEIAEVHGNLVLVTAQRAAVSDIGGNARIHDIASDLTLDNVGGSCEIARIGGTLALSNVGGNCRIESISGSLRAGHIGGSADFRATGPILTLGSIGGNLTLTDAPLGQEAVAAHAGSMTVGGSARI
ncbi:MAG TPA: hypothetical protein VKE41_00790, partial [Roseiflexaceae bacterium]|nr:hypothetical protein [Roseiflexaceae bacterium]